MILCIRLFHREIATSRLAASFKHTLHWRELFDTPRCQTHTSRAAYLSLLCKATSQNGLLWRCWLGGRKGIQSLKNLGEGSCGGGGAVSSVGVAPTQTVGTSAFIIFPCSKKIQKIVQVWGNPAWTQHSPMLRQKAECFFWYRPTPVVSEQRPLNGCCCCCCWHDIWSSSVDQLECFCRPLGI